MNVSWLFENDMFGEDIPGLAEEVRRQGMNTVFAATVPMRTWETYLDLFPPKHCVLFYGSLGFSRQIRREASWIPGTFHNPTNFLCTAYYNHFGPYLLAEEYVVVKWGDLINKKDFLFGEFGLENTIFLRPDSGEKPFSGRTMDYETFEEELPKIGYAQIPHDELVVVSPPRNISKEWRFIVADHQIITGSQYLPFRMRLREQGEDAEAWDFAQKIVSGIDWKPDRMWCIDICRTVAGNYYVLELNSFSCSGLYACRRTTLVKYASQLALDEWRKANGL